MDRGAWQATVHRFSRSQTWLKQLSMHACNREMKFTFLILVQIGCCTVLTWYMAYHHIIFYNKGPPNLQDLMQGDLRWSWCHNSNNNRNKGHNMWGLPSWLRSKESACQAGDTSLILGSGRAPEKEMATHSSILAWEIPWTEGPGGL